jgi:hypothetical protein
VIYWPRTGEQFTDASYAMAPVQDARADPVVSTSNAEEFSSITSTHHRGDGRRPTMPPPSDTLYFSGRCRSRCP